MKQVMKVEDQYQDVLQDIESAIVKVYRLNRSLTDYSVMRAFEAAISEFSTAAGQKASQPPSLSGSDIPVLGAIKHVCERRMGQTAVKEEEKPLEPLPVEITVLCLKRLLKSSNKWNKRGGRQGYLDFIIQFIRK